MSFWIKEKAIDLVHIFIKLGAEYSSIREG